MNIYTELKMYTWILLIIERSRRKSKTTFLTYACVLFLHKLKNSKNKENFLMLHLFFKYIFRIVIDYPGFFFMKLSCSMKQKQFSFVMS